VVVLCEVAIEVILVGRSSYHVLKAFVGVSQIGHVGQAVRAGGIAVSVGKVIDDVETQIRHLPSAVVVLEVAVEVVGDIAFGVVVGVYPKKTVVREVVGVIISKQISLPGKARAISVDMPLHGSDIAITSCPCPIRRAWCFLQVQRWRVF